jgi:hypothetical protein
MTLRLAALPCATAALVRSSSEVSKGRGLVFVCLVNMPYSVIDEQEYSAAAGESKA